MLIQSTRWFHDWLHRPLRVFWLCLAFGLVSLLFDGSLFRLWSLHRDQTRLYTRIDESRAQTKQLDFHIQEAQQSGFIERQARDQFDLVKEGDLIFIFADEPPNT
jgi:cell division protein FtsB